MPAHATIWRLLVRGAFVTPRPHKRPTSSDIRFGSAQPNERWQAGATDWQLADNTEIEIINTLDDTASFERHGLPASVLTDNAAVFTGRPRAEGQVAFEKLLAGLHIELRHRKLPPGNRVPSVATWKPRVSYCAEAQAP